MSHKEKKRKKITLTGEHSIDNIINHHYGNELTPEETTQVKAKLAVLNPHIPSLESFRNGDDFYLEDFEDEEEEELSGESSELSGKEEELSGESSELSGEPDLSTLESGQFNTGDQADTTHLPATGKKKKHD